MADWKSPSGPREAEKLKASGMFPRPDGWYKSIGGKNRYVCRPMPARDALELLPARVDEIKSRIAGTETIVRADSLALKDIADAYAAWLYRRLTTGQPKKLARYTYDDCCRAVSLFVECVGPEKMAGKVGPADFSRYSAQYLAGMAASTRARRVAYIEAFANWAAPGRRRAGMLVAPWQYGPDFAKPTAAELSAATGRRDKSYTADQFFIAMRRVRGSPIYRAAGLLGANCAFLARDVSTLPESLIDLDDGSVRFARGKTGVDRLCVLWPCTIKAIRRYLAFRPTVCDPTAEGMLFRTLNGLPYSRSTSDDDSPGREFDGIGNRWFKVTGLPFSGLRSTFATLSDDWPDQRAVDLVMGHSSHESIRSRHYAKRFDIDRIRKLSAYVWQSLAKSRQRPKKVVEPEPAAVSPSLAVDTGTTPASAGTRPVTRDTAAAANPAGEYPTPRSAQARSGSLRSRGKS